jgi:hypothetical protein
MSGQQHNDIFFIQVILREWQSSLTPPQMMVLLFIYDRTIGWGGKPAIVTIEHMVNGIPRLLKNGKPVHRGTGLSRTTAKQALKELIQLGVVKRDPIGRTWLYWINKKWEPTQPLRNRKSTNLVAAVAQITEPSGVQPRRGHDVTPEGSYCDPLGDHGVTAYGSTSDPHRSTSDLSWVELRPLRKNSRERTSEEETIAAPATPARDCPLDEAIPKAPARLASGQASTVRQTRDNLSPAHLEEVWCAAMMAAFPGEALSKWSVKQRGMVRSGLVKKVSFSGEKFVEFLQWVVAEWDLILHARFHWLSSPAPVRPDIGFVVGMRTHFFNAFASRDRILTEARLSFDDRQTLALNRQGFTEEEAKARMEERKSAGRTRVAVEEKRRDAERIIRIAQRMARGTPASPVSRERRATTFVRTPLPDAGS